VHVLRSLADALELRRELVPGRHLAIVGAGFVGTEVASTALALGVRVTLIDLAPPLRRALGAEVAGILARRFASHGATLRLGAAVAGVRVGPAGRVAAVRIDGQAEVPCDAALVAVGAEPTYPPLPAAEQLQGGVVTDAAGRTAVPGVYACGDAATSWQPLLGSALRVEHWTSAAKQGQAVARSILGLEAAPPELPYFWSDQLGLRLQLVGVPGDAAGVDVEGDEECFVARYRDGAGRPVAALTANQPREIGALRRELTAAAALAA
jgi:NADPH-dependent 2,4-dienoyl-CoA reductase/sulfur reductase-like enzyme